MHKLTNKEEEVMKLLWKREKAFVKELLADFPEPKPHYNTLSTMVRNLEEKGYVGHEAFGNTHRYFPTVTKEAYRKEFIGETLADFFDHSYKGLVSFFAREEKISADELREIIQHIEKQKD
ncbi:BlaI/MecI/CopY family transcriptional regulator [Robiginitalea sp. M366]|uniref:BlaI/MecI/CopY family transcriptional regulator n=1 Tax=Robiginitalea aestuariiviva TaxID=3036903 RepID=UPI00240D84BD|nr:BlaI/MecI/CopY family transcriptional regulator [Robiginitalea aestuariiviva]MDG1572278.1 BlaI/MecI/CopY family transcriptional regulator [Robiginitalea aestuariiviva]